MPLFPRSTFRRIACDRGLSALRWLDATRASQHCICVQCAAGAAVPSPLRNIP
jgi:hypothetical protein